MDPTQDAWHVVLQYGPIGLLLAGCGRHDGSDVHGQRQVGGDHARLQPRAEIGVEDHLADPADLAQSRQKQERWLEHFAVKNRVGLGLVAFYFKGCWRVCRVGISIPIAGLCHCDGLDLVYFGA